jgi:hypothetical protein
VLIAAIQPVLLIRLVPKKGFKGLLASGPLGWFCAFFKTRKKVGKGQENCVYYSCEITDIIFGHICLWVTYLLDNPNTKCCQQRVVTSLMSQMTGLVWAKQYPLQQNMGAAHSIAMFHYIVTRNDGTLFNLFASSDFNFFLG